MRRRTYRNRGRTSVQLDGRVCTSRSASGDGRPHAATITGRMLRIGDNAYPVVLPKLRDPRLHVAAVVVTLHVLGQLGLNFWVSVPQILAAILTAAMIEATLTFRRTRSFVSPASANAHRQRGGAHPPCSRDASGRHVEFPRVVRVRRRRGVLAPDPVRHPLSRLAPVQPVEHRAGRHLRRARQHPGRAARLLVGSAEQLDDHGLHRDPDGWAVDHPAPSPPCGCCNLLDHDGRRSRSSSRPPATA